VIQQHRLLASALGTNLRSEQPSMQPFADPTASEGALIAMAMTTWPARRSSHDAYLTPAVPRRCHGQSRDAPQIAFVTSPRHECRSPPRSRLCETLGASPRLLFHKHARLRETVFVMTVGSSEETSFWDVETCTCVSGPKMHS